VAPNRIDIMMDIPGVDFEEAWENKTESHYGEVLIFIMGLDELKKAKQQAGRDQDLLDLKQLKNLHSRDKTAI
jgi:hypothetical protein